MHGAVPLLSAEYSTGLIRGKNDTIPCCSQYAPLHTRLDHNDVEEQVRSEQDMQRKMEEMFGFFVVKNKCMSL